MSWQVCPICKGTGLVYGYGYSSSATCHICNGHRIISEQTGKPPIEIVQNDKQGA